MMERAFDPYLVPHTAVLANKAGILTQAELDTFEYDAVITRCSTLYRQLPRAQGTLEQLRWIHHYLFQDVYEWAGQIRKVDIAKGDGEPFQPLDFFDTGVQYSERVLREDNLLRGLDYEGFITRLSVSYNNFNILHPFREGNGRTQRVFWDIVAKDAGWHFDWGLTTRQINDQASIAAMATNDVALLVAMFRTITKPLSQPLVAEQQFSHLVDEQYHALANTARELSAKDYAALQAKYSYQQSDGIPVSAGRKRKKHHSR